MARVPAGDGGEDIAAERNLTPDFPASGFRFVSRLAGAGPRFRTLRVARGATLRANYPGLPFLPFVPQERRQLRLHSANEKLKAQDCL